MITTSELLCVADKTANPMAVRTVHPSAEGFNIDLYLGFKHFGYLVEEGILLAFRDAALGPRMLYSRYGLNLEVVGVAMRLLTTIQLDDLVRVEVWPETRDSDTALRFRVGLTVDRGGKKVTAATAEARVVFRPDGRVAGSEPPREELRRFVWPAERNLRRPRDLDGSAKSHSALIDSPEIRQALGVVDRNSIIWKLRVPYYYCHYTDHLQVSGYWRIIEQAVDLFLAARGISIGRFLVERDWIPVVLEARFDVLADVWMEEDLYTVLTVDRLHGEAFWPCQIDCYVLRDGQPVHAGTGHITHAYAKLIGPGEAVACQLDLETQVRLCPGGRS